MPTDIESLRINSLFEKEKWSEARRFIERELEHIRPDDWIRHWWLTRLSATYYEQRDYDKALGIVWRAHTIAPDCPLVLWDLAGTLEMQGDLPGAVELPQTARTRRPEHR